MDPDFNEVTNNNLQKISNSLNKMGYKDGITDGRDSQFQVGFDLGYSDGLKTSLEIAKWNSIMSTMKKNYSHIDQSLIENMSQKSEILSAPDKDHFQMNKMPEETIENVSKAQREYSASIEKELNEKYEPIKRFLT